MGFHPPGCLYILRAFSASGLPCVAGCEGIRVHEGERLFRVVDTDQVIREGDDISIDWATGEVFAGIIKTVDPDFDKETDLKSLLEWADQFRRLGVWANADYPRDAQASQALIKAALHRGGSDNVSMIVASV